MRENKKTLEERLSETQMKLTMQGGILDLMYRAYDALKNHGVDYRTLRVYREKDNPLFDTTPRPVKVQHDRVILWLSRMVNDLNGAVKRKGIKEVPKG